MDFMKVLLVLSLKSVMVTVSLVFIKVFLVCYPRVYVFAWASITKTMMLFFLNVQYFPFKYSFYLLP